MININQHNYEEFFLLYADGELSAADKLAVEQFVQVNPGLAEELEMLQMTRLTDDPPLVFDQKELLYRNEAAEISYNNYEEQFLLYTDNELDTAAREKTEKFVLQHPGLQEAFTLLKQTKLEPETIVFPDKESLYRKEAKTRPVVYLRWQRIAVAAALTGFAVLVWMQLPVDKLSTKPIAKLQPKTALPEQPSVNKTEVPALMPETTKELTEKENSYLIAEAGNKKSITEVSQQQMTDPAITIQEKNDQAVAGITEPAKTISTTDASLYASENIHAPVQKLPANSASINRDDLVTVTDPPRTEQPADPIIRTVVYKELDTDDDSKTLLLGSLEINKDKLRGFFRKAGNLFRSKAKAEDEKSDTHSPSNTRSFK